MAKASTNLPRVLFIGLDDAASEVRNHNEWESVILDRPRDLEDAERVDLVVFEDCAQTDWIVETAHARNANAIIVVDGDARTAMTRLVEEDCDVFVCRPIDFGHLRRLIIQEIRTDKRRHRESQDTPVPRIVGESGWIREICEQIGYMAPSAAPVLLSGESGTGKEIVARAIHALSPRRHGPLTIINCGAIPPELIESELFGHEKGSFTGASERRAGCFETAHEGTLFLDEIGELLPKVQVKLLRALQDGKFTRVGGEERIEVDVRIIAATNRNLQTEIEKGTFRQDLFYRLNVLHMKLPSLRERPIDVKVLWEHFVDEAARQEGTPPLSTTEEVLAALERYDWPGNVRELKNVARRVVAMRPAREVTPTALPAQVRNKTSSDELRIPGMTLDEIERYAILKTYRATGSARETAKQLGVSERKIFYRLKQYREEDSEAEEDDRPLLALVEDDHDLRMALTDLLSRSYRVEAYDSAEDLLDTVDEDPPAVIVTDLRLPDADGLELLDQLTAEHDIPVILISAFANEEAKEHALKQGAVAFLDKPVDTILLGRVLERATSDTPPAAE